MGRNITISLPFRGRGSPAPRRVQDNALNLTWFMGWGWGSSDVYSFSNQPDDLLSCFADREGNFIERESIVVLEPVNQLCNLRKP